MFFSAVAAAFLLVACGGGGVPAEQPAASTDPAPAPTDTLPLVVAPSLVDLQPYGLADETPAEDVEPLTAIATSALPTTASSRPNLILIMTDDQSMRDLAAMPNVLRYFRDQGAAFANSFASWPLCCPSRATTFTGQYAHNHNVLGNSPPLGAHQAFDDAETLPVWLQRAGYRTTHIGKYLNAYGADARGSTYVPPGWTDWMGFVDFSTYQMWGYTVNHNGVLRTYGELRTEDPALYQTDVVRQLALDSIDAGIASGQPFFLSVAFLAPHEEVREAAPAGVSQPGPRPAPRHAGTFSWVPLPRPASFEEPDLSDKPAVIRALALAGVREGIDKRTFRFRRRLESLRAVDEAVWAILQRLGQNRLLSKTYIVFTSDNGWFNGEHGLPGGKYLMYEPSIRVPLLVRGPGIAAGTSNELVANVDLAPTFLELAGASASGRVVDGRSLVPYARDVRLRSRRPILLDAPLDQWTAPPHTAGAINIPAMRGLRTPLWSYVEYGTGEVELYDLARDPAQLQSLHASTAHHALLTAFRQVLSHYAGCVGDTCRLDLGAVPR